jgi:cbb3-type cytochrome oxidase cytochrome c subunit
MTDTNWHMIHLYSPQAFMDAKAGQKSSMPPYRHLFELKKIMPQGSSIEALKLPPSVHVPEGFEVVPTAEAKALTAYLLSLRQDVNLFEAPMYAPTPKTNSVSQPATNGVAK